MIRNSVIYLVLGCIQIGSGCDLHAKCESRDFYKISTRLSYEHREALRKIQKYTHELTLGVDAEGYVVLVLVDGLTRYFIYWDEFERYGLAQYLNPEFLELSKKIRAHSELTDSTTSKIVFAHPKPGDPRIIYVNKVKHRYADVTPISRRLKEEFKNYFADSFIFQAVKAATGTGAIFVFYAIGLGPGYVLREGIPLEYLVSALVMIASSAFLYSKLDLYFHSRDYIKNRMGPEHNLSLEESIGPEIINEMLNSIFKKEYLVK
jgi:hypothetical protein